jgi:ABC-type uncharacterized transport system substrate-binding protein
MKDCFWRPRSETLPFIRVGLGIFALAIGILTAPVSYAQPAGKVFRIGVLSLGLPNLDPAGTGPLGAAFVAGLRDLGYVEGKNIVIERRAGAGDMNRLNALAAELVQWKPDVILAGGNIVGQVLARATRTVPIVVSSCDPYQFVVQSLAHPGGNVTGLTCMSAELSPKRLELLKEALPALSRVAFLYYPDDPAPEYGLQLSQSAAPKLGLKIDAFPVRNTTELLSSFAAIGTAQPDALFVYPDLVLGSMQAAILDFAARNRHPSIFGAKGAVAAGGLMSYGADLPNMFRRAATFVDKIFKGERPGDLPVEQPTRLELVINLKTAKALGLTVPPALLSRADEAIE